MSGQKAPLSKTQGETKAWKYEETIEALRRAEQKYRSIFENATEGVFQTTPDGQYLSANPALARMYGYDSPEELLAALTDISRQLYVQAGRRAEFTLAMLQNGQVLDFESQIYRRDGTIIWISENAHAVHDELNGELNRPPIITATPKLRRMIWSCSLPTGSSKSRWQTTNIMVQNGCWQRCASECISPQANYLAR